MAKLLKGSNSQELARKEKWSQDESTADANYDSCAKSKKVSFSKYSIKRVYVSDPNYENWKSYSSADQQTFRKEAAHDAFRIKHLLSISPLPAGLAIHEFMKQGKLTREDLLGIEHLVSMNAEKAMRDQRSYMNLVLGVQKQMREKNENEINAGMLAVIAVAKSSRMIEKARLRAALAS